MPAGTLAIRWISLLLLSVCTIIGFLTVHLAAGFMLGPMIAGIIMAVSRHELSIQRPFFAVSQAVLACLATTSISIPVLQSIIHHGPLILFSILSVIIISFGTGAVLAWFGVMPSTTALWGSSPGGASTMILICGSFGADPRLAAFMLYFRVVLVAVTTSLVAWFVTDGQYEADLAPVSHGDTLPTLALVIMSGLLGMKIRFPAAPLLLTMFLGGAAQLSGLFHICAPQWVRIPACLIIGWSIGLRFTAPVLRHALRSLPAVMLSSCILIAACALLALPVAKFAHIDLLSAYLATSPGGLDTIIIISANMPVALPFIISLQTARLLTVLAIGPVIARPLGRWLDRHRCKRLITGPQ